MNSQSISGDKTNKYKNMSEHLGTRHLSNANQPWNRTKEATSKDFTICNNIGKGPIAYMLNWN